MLIVTTLETIIIAGGSTFLHNQNTSDSLSRESARLAAATAVTVAVLFAGAPAPNASAAAPSNDAFAAAINDPVVKDKLLKVGAVPVANSPAEFATMLKAEYERWGKVVHAKGIKEPK